MKKLTSDQKEAIASLLNQDKNNEQRIYFRDVFREARTKALNNSENFEDVIFALEKPGKYLRGEKSQNGDLGTYEPFICYLAGYSCLSNSIPSSLPEFHTDFCTLYSLLRKARNSAMHEGVFARNITRHAIEVAIILEDALMSQEKRVRDFMVRNPICAFGWQPLSFVRQNMLANSFSYLPVFKNNEWKLISDLSLTKHLQEATDERERNTRLSEKLEKSTITLIDAITKDADQFIKNVVEKWDGFPICVTAKESNEIVRILTPFDLL